MAIRCCLLFITFVLKKIFKKTLKFAKSHPLMGQIPGNPVRDPIQDGAAMTSTEVLAMYENLAALSGRMASAAGEGDWDQLAQLETQCALQAAAARAGVPPLDDMQRRRKIALLKQIMANDRAVREVTEPWINRALATH
jgi:flagellar protein FliT